MFSLYCCHEAMTKVVNLLKIVLKNNALEEFMNKKNLNVYSLAKMLDVAPSTIYRILNGSRGIGNDMIAKLLFALGLNESDFDKLFILVESLPCGNDKLD